MRKVSQLPEILNVQSGDFRVRRQGLRIQNPGAGDDFLQGQKMAFAQGAPPVLPQGAHPEQGEPQLFLEERFPRRRHLDGPLEGIGLELRDIGNVR